MPATWIIGVFAILVVVLYPVLSLKIESERHKRLLQIQADKRGGQVDKSLTLALPMGNYRLLISPDLYANQSNYKVAAFLGWSGNDLLEQVTRFPKVAIFKKQVPSLLPELLLGRDGLSETKREEAQVRQKQKRFVVNDEGFDRAFTVYAENEADIHWMLTSEIRQGLLGLASQSPRIRTDEMRFFAVSKNIKDTNTYDSFIDLAVTISKRFAGNIVS